VGGATCDPSDPNLPIMTVEGNFADCSWVRSVGVHPAGPAKAES